jgi:uncharacterized protein YcsI (UPF0317 family)
MAVTANPTEQPAQAARVAIRAGAIIGPTAGLAHGYVQGNVAMAPSAVADDFARYCTANSRACPVLAGDPGRPELGKDIEIRTDLPRYFV